VQVRRDDIGSEIGDTSEDTLYCVEADDGDRIDFRWRDLRPV